MPALTLPEMRPDVVATLGDGRSAELWINVTSGDGCDWETFVDGVQQPDVYTRWPNSRDEAESYARDVLVFLGLPVASMVVL